MSKDGFIVRTSREPTVAESQTSPIQRVPFEILSEIFTICSKRELLSPTKIASVCHLWRETIFATPLAWTRICSATVEERKVSHEKYRRFLELSNPHLLFSDMDHVLVQECRLFDQSPSAAHQMCACLKIRQPFSYSDRLRCLSIESSWLANEYPTLIFPNLEHLTFRTARPTRKIDMSRFPKLWHLRIPSNPGSITLLDFSNPCHPQLRYLESRVVYYDFWLPVVNQFVGSLRTLSLSGHFVTGLKSKRKVECPQLQVLIIRDNELFPSEDILLELSVPRLIYLHYRSRERYLPPNLIRDHKGLVQIRTNMAPKLRDYPSLRILQTEGPTCMPLLDIAAQLESESSLCPNLRKIEAKLDEIPDTLIDNVQGRIRNRNEKTGSDIMLVVCKKWLTSAPIDLQECEDDAPCHSWAEGN